MRYTILPTFIYLIVILTPAIPVNIKLQVIAKKHHKVIILIKIYLKFDSFKGNSSLFSWIYRLATNETLSFLRKKKVSKVALDNAQTQAADSFFEYGDKEALALHDSIHALPAKQQTVFNLRYYDELSFKQIAEITSTSENAAKANYCFAKQKIIERMKLLEV